MGDGIVGPGLDLVAEARMILQQEAMEGEYTMIAMLMN